MPEEQERVIDPGGIEGFGAVAAVCKSQMVL